MLRGEPAAPEGYHLGAARPFSGSFAFIEQCGFDFCRAIAQQLYGFLI